MSNTNPVAVSRIPSVDGTMIAWWTSGSGPPLVVVHGTPADHTRWRPLLPFLEPHVQEIAIRVALGATPGAILGHVLWRGLRPLLGGLLVGSVLAIVMSRVLESQLYRVQPTDPATIGGTAVVLLIVAALATYVPARRALRVAPASALTD